MKILNKLKGAAVAVLALCSVTFGSSTFAQTTPPAQQQVNADFSDAELKQFAEANTRLLEIQQATEKKMLAVLEEEKLSVEKFNEMAQAHHEQKLAEMEATPEEMAAFNKAAQRIMEMQPTMQQDVETAIQKDGMTLEQYEKIMLAYQQSPAVQEKVNQLMIGKQ